MYVRCIFTPKPKHAIYVHLIGDHMLLTRYTDFGMRLLRYLGRQPEKSSSIAEIVGNYAISQSHLIKVVSALVYADDLESIRRHDGGIRFGIRPEGTVLGALIHHLEEDFGLADCSLCLFASACGLISILEEALAALLKVLEGYTLADVREWLTDFSGFLQQMTKSMGGVPVYRS